MTYVGVKCLTRHCSVVFYVTHELVVQRREDHGIYEDLNSHLLTLTQLAEESTALTVCPFGQKVRRGGDYLSYIP